MHQLRALAVRREISLLRGSFIECASFIGQPGLFGRHARAQQTVQAIRAQLQRDSIFRERFDRLMLHQQQIAQHFSRGDIDLILTQLVLLVGGLSHRGNGIFREVLGERFPADDLIAHHGHEALKECARGLPHRFKSLIEIRQRGPGQLHIAQMTSRNARPQ